MEPIRGLLNLYTQYDEPPAYSDSDDGVPLYPVLKPYQNSAWFKNRLFWVTLGVEESSL